MGVGVREGGTEGWSARVEVRVGAGCERGWHRGVVSEGRSEGVGRV